MYIIPIDNGYKFEVFSDDEKNCIIIHVPQRYIRSQLFDFANVKNFSFFKSCFILLKLGKF